MLVWHRKKAMLVKHRLCVQNWNLFHRERSLSFRAHEIHAMNGAQTRVGLQCS